MRETWNVLLNELIQEAKDEKKMKQIEWAKNFIFWVVAGTIVFYFLSYFNFFGF